MGKRATLRGQTRDLAEWAHRLRLDDLDEPTRHAAVRHAIDTIGVIVAGSQGELTGRVASLMREEAEAGVGVPGLSRQFGLLDAIYISGCAAHGLELDDGYRQGSVHPGVAVIPPAIALAEAYPTSGARFLPAVVAGYEIVTAVARACHPRLRARGFHPTSVVGVLGSALAASCVLELDSQRTADTLGISASSAGGLFAFLGGGADVKRLHAGHAAREGAWAALLARNGIAGPPAVLEARDGFLQAFPGLDDAEISLPSSPSMLGINDCYIKPYPCCRHLQPALEALIDLAAEHALNVEEIERVEVETYSIAASHAATPWDSMASAQLSFPYILSLGLSFGSVELKHFDEACRSDPEFGRLASRIHIRSSAEMDRRYPGLRPARVTLHTRTGRYDAFREEARGAPEHPLADEDLSAKFLNLVEPVCGKAVAQDVLAHLWKLEDAPDVAAILRRLVPLGA